MTEQRPPIGRRSLAFAAAATLAACALLVGLGLWQLQRLAWKEELIAKVAARAGAAPAPLPPESDWATLKPEDYEYRHVRFEGVYELDKEALVFRAAGGALRQPGYFVLTPARLASGAAVIVNRGFVPLAQRDRAARPEPASGSPQPVTGLMRQPEPRNLFTPADDPARGEYFTRDPALIAARFGLTRAAPFSIDADRGGAASGPEGGATEIAFPNNHLSYALTWFGLALGLAGVFAVFVWQNRRAIR
ncbi:Surfeit locus 1 family protein [Methylocella silvestris BL2]|uniref:SURF1-like protein n=1 Tax=Methylocella silvestris (strain DSM 15510 / CIP 108128 / LMG 27833 / NCIMB 13906 / BL2) TaxID=395965 RepID=B8EPL4_METSB|nr:SURF1 family cytochrome oxidase biogenesis protein [Methylocella silvestris]ACK50219.1 Surfeit locus 1 family protein [Methylocella silvestris BL2]